jgi:hypothetical protein
MYEFAAEKKTKLKLSDYKYLQAFGSQIKASAKHCHGTLYLTKISNK